MYLFADITVYYVSLKDYIEVEPDIFGLETEKNLLNICPVGK